MVIGQLRDFSIDTMKGQEVCLCSMKYVFDATENPHANGHWFQFDFY